MEFEWSPEEQAFREKLRKFIKENLPEDWWKHVPGEDPYSDTTIEFCKKLSEQGWFAPHWPKEYGGGGDNSPWRFAILSEELWASGEPRGSQYMNVNWVGPAVISAGTEEQKRRFISLIASGTMLWCQGFSEMEAGSDLGSLTTTAIRDGDDYIINGEKVWTSYAMGAHYCFLLARTDLSTTRNSGISIFLIPMDTPGIHVEVIPTMLDIHVVHKMTFKDVRVPAENRLGEENGGWSIIREALARERVGTPRYSRSLRVLDSIVAEGQRTGRLTEADIESVVRARTACEAARLMTYRIRQLGNGQESSGEAYVARGIIVRAERAVAEVTANLGGMEGLVSGSLADGELRTTLIAGLGGGSYEVQLNLIARLWLNLPKAS